MTGPAPAELVEVLSSAGTPPFPWRLATVMTIRIDALEPAHAAVLRDLQYSLLVEIGLGSSLGASKPSRDERPGSARASSR